MIPVISKSKRLVIKVGSSSITGAQEANLDRIVDAVVTLRSLDKDVLLVSSGAIATASPLMGLAARPEDLATSQALAGIGQARLMSRYQTSLERHKLISAQMLLTVDNLESRESSGNAQSALERMLQLGVLPIINENDSVATQEIRFGDNDQLAARVAILAHADLLVLLSDIDGLYTQPPEVAGAQRIDFVEYGDNLEGYEVSGTSTGYGTGGAVTKLMAARLATDRGIPVIVTRTSLVSQLAVGDFPHTFFAAKELN